FKVGSSKSNLRINPFPCKLSKIFCEMSSVSICKRQPPTISAYFTTPGIDCKNSKDISPKMVKFFLPNEVLISVKAPLTKSLPRCKMHTWQHNSSNGDMCRHKKRIELTSII